MFPVLCISHQVQPGLQAGTIPKDRFAFPCPKLSFPDTFLTCGTGTLFPSVAPGAHTGQGWSQWCSLGCSLTR